MPWLSEGPSEGIARAWGRPEKADGIMSTVKKTYIRDASGNKTAVVLPLERYQGLLKELYYLRALRKRHAKRLVPRRTIPRTARGREQPLTQQYRTFYLGKAPRSFSFQGQEVAVASWRRLLVGLCAMLHERHPKDFAKVLRFRSSAGRMYFSRDPSALREPIPIPGTDTFAEGHWSASGDVVRRCHGILRWFGYEPSDLQIEAS